MTRIKFLKILAYWAGVAHYTIRNSRGLVRRFLTKTIWMESNSGFSLSKKLFTAAM